MIQVMNYKTGEVAEYAASSPDEIMSSWLEISETIKLYEAAKDQLKKLVPEIVNDKGVYENGDYMFRYSSIQRYSYDKSVMRELLDPDVFDVLTEPSKTKVDKYLKDNLDDLGEATTALRESMVAVGKPYSVVKLERIK